MARTTAAHAILSLSAAAALLYALPSYGDNVTCAASEAAAIAEKLEVIAVPDYQGDPADYKPDGDPNTLELVMLPKRKGVTSHVTPDGEVVFVVGKVSDKLQQQLFQQAFCLKAAASHR